MTPGAGPFLTPGAWLAGFIKRTTIHCYIQTLKALSLVVFEKMFFYVFPLLVYGSYMLPLKQEFFSGLEQNLMQPVPHSNNASGKI